MTNDNLPIGWWHDPEDCPEENREVIVEYRATGSHEVCLYRRGTDRFCSSVTVFKHCDIGRWAYVSDFLPIDIKSFSHHNKNSVTSLSKVYSELMVQKDGQTGGDMSKNLFCGYEIRDAYEEGAKAVLSVLEPLSAHTTGDLKSGYDSLCRIISSILVLKGLSAMDIKAPLLRKGRWYVCVEETGWFKVGRAYRSDDDGWVSDGYGGCTCHSWYFRPWCLTDAEPGDILMSPRVALYPWVGIFRRMNGDGVNVYGFLEAGHNHFKIDNITHSVDGLYPADKQTSDILFKKMKEAGYKWDAFKLELSKISGKK